MTMFAFSYTSKISRYYFILYILLIVNRPVSFIGHLRLCCLCVVVYIRGEEEEKRHTGGFLETGWSPSIS